MLVLLKRLRRLGLLCLAVTGTLLVAAPVLASVNLPLHHWTYDAIERLTALGIIEGAMITAKPYSRLQAAKQVAGAIERIRSREVSIDGRRAVAEPLLERLIKELRPELVGLGVLAGPGSTATNPLRVGGRVQTEVGGFFVGGGQTVRFRENRGGEYYANGAQNQTDVRGWAELGNWASLVVQPKFISNRQTLGIGATNNSQNFYLREFSLKLSYFNVAFEIGRGTQWWGPGYHGSLLLTDHAFPLDMIKLGSDEPFRLPWLLKGLGEWKLNSFLAQLERDRDFSRANIFGLRLSYLPTPWLELGLTRLTQFGGRGRGQSFPEAVFDTYANSPNQGGDLDVNEQAMGDIRVRIPHVPYLVPFPGGMQMYGELASEDKWNQLPFPSRAAILLGVYVPQVFTGDTMDLRIEYADTDWTRRKTEGNLAQVWYNNGTYLSGMRHRGFPLGHHMGTDGINFFVRTTRFLTDELQLGASFNLQERDRGQPVHERKREASMDLTWWVTNRAQLTVGYTFQRIKNPGQITSINPFIETFANGVTATNHLLWTSVSVEF